MPNELKKVPRDAEKVGVHLTASTNRGDRVRPIFLDRWDTIGPSSAMPSVIRLFQHIARIFRDAYLPRDTTATQPYIDRERLEQLRAKKLDMSQRLDDHANQDFSTRWYENVSHQ